MNEKKINYIITIICITILGTIGIQLFWNYENYKTNEVLLFNEIQNSFEETVENYYTAANKKRMLTIFDTRSDSISSMSDALKFLEVGTMFSKIDSTSTELPDLPSDSILLDSFSVKAIRGKRSRNTPKELNSLKNSITITIPQDSIDLLELSEPLHTTLAKKNIKISFQIEHLKTDTIFATQGNLLEDKEVLETISKSELIPLDETLKLRFTNPLSSIFKRGLFGILISLALALATIFSLLYLVRIIKQQKQLSEIKNDLINNITHEFKTPIAIVLAAIEGITGFSSENQNVKTNKYLQISKDQLYRLNTMVEKLLETAAINSENLELKKSSVDVVLIMDKIVRSAKNNYPNKKITYTSDLISETSNIDEFHFENAINNLLDNAAKYGGGTINVNLSKKNRQLTLSVLDNGKGIPAREKEKIFEKFYRVPSGNQHDIRGFGIGLYYSKNIILKHGGKLDLISTSNSNEFRITL